MTGWRLVETRFGDVGVEAGPLGVRQVWLPGTLPHGFATMPGDDAEERMLDAAELQLTEYAAGERRRFELPLDESLLPVGFAGEALRRLADIAFGEVASYGEVAVLAGRPRAARAVGTACSKNPLPLLLPCHRVVRSNDLGSYGGGEALKAALLAHEFAHSDAPKPAWWRG